MRTILLKLQISQKAFVLGAIIFSNVLWGQTNFEQQPIDPDHTAVSGVACHDYDLDGDIDIFACHLKENELVLWENDGNFPPTWTKNVILDVITNPLYIVSEDVNGDSYKDLIFGGNTNSIFCMLNVEAQNQWEFFMVDDDFNNPHGVSVSDMNNDGLKDIIAGARNDHTIAWWENNGENPDTWTKHIVTEQINGTQSIAVSDINNDGFQDIVGGSSISNKVMVYYHNGDSPPTFTEQVANQSLQLPHWVSVADINEDGNPDILVAACVSSKVAWLENNGGNPISWTQHNIGNNFGCALTIEAADIDMDGDLDVAATAWGTNRVAWWEHTQNGSQINWQTHYLSTNYKGAWPLVFSDMDNDSDLDFVTGGDVENGPGPDAPLSWWENKTLTTAIENQNTEIQSSFNIWPQPATSLINLSYTLNKDSHVEISILNFTGKPIETILDKKQEKGAYTLEIDLTSLKNNYPPGIYLLKLKYNNTSHNNKLIIANQR